MLRTDLRAVTPDLLTLTEEPFYQPTGNEQQIFESAWQRRLPVLLKGPTGCGKTRFVEYMAWQLEASAGHRRLPRRPDHRRPGRPLPDRRRRNRLDGWPADRCGARGRDLLSRRDRRGAQGHHRGHPPAGRQPARAAVDKRGELLPAPDDFMLVISYNPGYQSILKELKPCTRQRFVAIEFDYPAPDLEAKIVATEGGVDDALAPQAGQARRTDPQPQGPGPRRRREHAPARARRATGRCRQDAAPKPPPPPLPGRSPTIRT